MSTVSAQFIELAVRGMDCPSCAATIERRLRQLGGVTECQVNFAAGRVGVGYLPEQIGVGQLEEALERLGHPVQRERSKQEAVPFWTAERRRLGWTVLAGFLIALGFGLRWAGVPAPLWIACYALSMACGGGSIARSAWDALRSRHAADINVLMTVAAVGAAAIGDWAEAATVLFLFSIAEALEAFSMDRTRHAIRGLMELAPEEATVLHADEEHTVPVREVAAGAIVLVRPGGRIPLDGEVVGGRSSVNEAAITGEAIAVAKAEGDTVYGGTLNEAGQLVLRVTRAAGDTTLARIVALIEEAQARRSPTEQIVDRFARVYTPAILALAVALAVVPALFGGDAQTWFYRALTLLIIACPCALVISTPVAVVCGLARAARAGALIKGGTYLERLGVLRALAFDKTGTLTHGEPIVTDGIALDGVAEDALLALAASAEYGSEHAVGRAIVHAAQARGLALSPAREFAAVPGLGVRAEIAGQSLTVGREEWLRELGFDTTPAQARVTELQEAGKSVVLVARGSAMIGLIAVADRARESGPAVVRELQTLGIERIAMLTGDNAATARAVAARAGIGEYYAGLLPAEKVALVERMRSETGDVAMVGDGINDAPALAAASVGIAMGAAGTDVALETADVALMGDDLSRLPFVIALSRRTLGIIRQNIAFSIAVKVAFILLTLVGISSLWLAVLADTGTSVLVVLNSLRLLRVPDPR